jgi:hypothetical protein
MGGPPLKPSQVDALRSWLVRIPTQTRESLGSICDDRDGSSRLANPDHVSVVSANDVCVEPIAGEDPNAPTLDAGFVSRR